MRPTLPDSSRFLIRLHEIANRTQYKPRIGQTLSQVQVKDMKAQSSVGDPVGCRCMPLDAVGCRWLDAIRC